MKKPTKPKKYGPQAIDLPKWEESYEQHCPTTIEKAEMEKTLKVRVGDV